MPKNSPENTNQNDTATAKKFLKEKMSQIQHGFSEKTEVADKVESLQKGITYLNGAADFANELGVPEEDLSIFDAGIDVLTKQMDTVEAQLKMEKLLG